MPHSALLFTNNGGQSPEKIVWCTTLVYLDMAKSVYILCASFLILKSSSFNELIHTYLSGQPVTQIDDAHAGWMSVRCWPGIIVLMPVRYSSWRKCPTGGRAMVNVFDGPARLFRQTTDSVHGARWQSDTTASEVPTRQRVFHRIALFNNTGSISPSADGF